MVVGAATCAQQLAQAILRGQQDLDAAGAGADDADPQRSPCVREHALEHALPMRDEAVDRLDRHDISGGARHVGGARCRTDVERQEVVTDRWVRRQCTDWSVKSSPTPRHGRSRAPAKRQSGPRSICASSNV